MRHVVDTRTFSLASASAIGDFFPPAKHSRTHRNCARTMRKKNMRVTEKRKLDDDKWSYANDNSAFRLFLNKRNKKKKWNGTLCFISFSWLFISVQHSLKREQVNYIHKILIILRNKVQIFKYKIIQNILFSLFLKLKNKQSIYKYSISNILNIKHYFSWRIGNKISIFDNGDEWKLFFFCQRKNINS